MTHLMVIMGLPKNFLGFGRVDLLVANFSTRLSIRKISEAYRRLPSRNPRSSKR